MDDTATQNTPAASQSMQDLDQGNQQQVSSTQPVARPISGVHKELGPIGSSELIKPSEQEPVIPPEVAEAGVETVRDRETPQLTPHDGKAGLSHANEAVSVHTSPSGFVQLPKTEEEVKKELKLHHKIGNSITWFLTTLLRQWKMLNRKSERE